MNFDISVTNKEVTPRCDMIFLKQMLNKMSFRTVIENCPDLTVSVSNRLHKIYTII